MCQPTARTRYVYYVPFLYERKNPSVNFCYSLPNSVKKGGFLFVCFCFCFFKQPVEGNLHLQNGFQARLLLSSPFSGTSHSEGKKSTHVLNSVPLADDVAKVTIEMMRADIASYVVMELRGSKSEMYSVLSKAEA